MTGTLQMIVHVILPVTWWEAVLYDHFIVSKPGSERLGALSKSIFINYISR